MTYQSIENAFKNARLESVKAEKARAKKEKITDVYQADADIFQEEKKKNLAASFKFAAALKKELKNLQKILPEFDFEIKPQNDRVYIQTNVPCVHDWNNTNLCIVANNDGLVIRCIFQGAYCAWKNIEARFNCRTQNAFGLIVILIKNHPAFWTGWFFCK